MEGILGWAEKGGRASVDEMLFPKPPELKQSSCNKYTIADLIVLWSGSLAKHSVAFRFFFLTNAGEMDGVEEDQLTHDNQT